MRSGSHLSARSRRGPDRPDKAETDIPRFLSRGVVAQLFGVSVSTVTRWAQRGLLPAVRTPGGHYRFPADEVKKAVERGGTTEMTRLD